jgi:Uncharacterized protein conserved in bacteria
VIKRSDQWAEIKQRAESDFVFFSRLVRPTWVFGAIHEDSMRWLERPGYKSHQLLLLPRDHLKSTIMGLRVAYRLTREPWLKFLYISSTANLAIKQLKFIKDILTSRIYRRYWPEMVNAAEGSREKWTETEISVDHPARKAEAIRDPSIFTAGLTTNIVGLHCDICVLDDVVTNDTAYTEEGRERVKQQYSLLASIEAGNAEEWVVGTRYHPDDLYNSMLQAEIRHYDDFGDELEPEPLYEVKEHQVEDAGDGSGEYLWPLQRRYDGKWFGFDRKILERKRAAYLDQTQFRAQYYNDPHDITSAGIKSDYFQYYDRSHVSRNNGKWYCKGKRLNVFAAMDFAFSLGKSADYTSIVVVGIDGDRNYYVLDIDRFRTGDLSEYYNHILRLHQKWDFRKLRAEVTMAQKVIVQNIRDDYIRRDGLALSIEEYRPEAREGTKAERIYNTLQPRYANLQMWHYRGGNCQILEEELIYTKPPHDDVKDALASVIPICMAPSNTISSGLTNRNTFNLDLIHTRFGGVA